MDEFKSVVPSPSTPSRRTTPQQPQLTIRRPSDGNKGTAPTRASPRVKVHIAKEPADTPTSVVPQSETPASPQDASDDVSNATFITALLATKQRPKRSGDSQRQLNNGQLLLRPPSPLEAADADRPAPSTGEPLPANYVGPEALQAFWHLFHREEQVYSHTLPSARPPSPSPSSSTTSRTLPLLSLPAIGRPHSARFTYLAAVRKLHLSPEPLGIVRRCATDGSASPEIDLRSYRMGDAYATAFSESFALVPGVEAVNLAQNRISDAVAARLVRSALLGQASQTLVSLNLSHNALGAHAAVAIAELLHSSKSLTSLNVAHNRLKDRDIALLCDALQKNQTLARVHLSENRFGTSGMVAIAKFLEENAKIEEVYLAWNNLRGVGALKIVEALKFHASLRALDLSWNALASTGEKLKPRAIVTALADALANNKVLAHLDLANNHLDMDDCALLAKQLELNHSLIGLHMSGNCGAMDSRGFLIPKQTAAKLQDQHKMYSIAVFEEAMSESGSGALPAHVAPLVDKFCWYCGQWSEHRFTFTPDAAVASVQLHLSVEDWRGVAMERRDDSGDGAFLCYCVLPPGKTEYYFSTTTEDGDVCHHYLKEKAYTRVVGCSLPADLQYVNVLRNARRDGRDPCNTLQPRFSGRSLGRAAKWDINRSVFSRRRRESVQRGFVDTDTFIQKACAADWRQCKVDRFVKDAARRKEVEASVARHFRTIASVYRKYCGHNVLTSVAVVAAMTPAVAMQIQTDILSVPWSGYMEFLTECKVLDEGSDYCRYADCENVFVAANLELTQEAKEKDNPDRSLTRFEFVEVVMRIAINKYLRTNVCETPAKAVDKLILDHLVPNCPEDPNDFRTRFLYTEEVSDVFSEHVVVLQDIYNSNMGKYCKPGEKKGMQLAEFLGVMERYQIYAEHFKIRDVKDPFLACKLLVLDEMSTVGHKKLFLTDFMELLLRVAVLRYPPAPAKTVKDVAASLLQLLIHHFLKHEALLDAFRETVDQALVQQRLEAFAGAIKEQQQHSTRPAKRGSAPRISEDAVAEEEDEDEDKEEDEEEEEQSPPHQPDPSIVAAPPEGSGSVAAPPVAEAPVA